MSLYSESRIINASSVGMLMIRLVVSCFCFCLLIACASSAPGGGSPLQIVGVKFENHTSRVATAVKLLVPLTGGFVSCGNIPQQSMCSSTFPETSYTGNPIEITWSQAGQTYSTGKFTLTLPDDLEPGLPAMVHVVIAGPGSAGAVIVQRQRHSD